MLSNRSAEFCICSLSLPFVSSVPLQYWNSWRWLWEWELCWTPSCKRCLRYSTNSVKENSTDATSSLYSPLASYYIPLKMLLNLVPSGTSFLVDIPLFSCCFPMSFLAFFTSPYLHNHPPLRRRALNLQQPCVSGWIGICRVGKVEHGAVWTGRKKASQHALDLLLSFWENVRVV